MAELKKCSQCGAELPPDAPGGHCPNCLLNFAIAPVEETAKPPATIPISPLTEVSPIEKPGDRIGHYKLLQQVGEGGMGTVWMAEQSEPVRRKVALKVVKLGMDTRQVVARFEAERQALALMDHPNIAKVLDAGATETGRPYFVMELVRGIKITDYCDQKNLPTRDRLDLFIKVCQAIQHAHQKGIIHRDIKPSNILVTMSDGVPVPKVIDFGIAKAITDQKLTDKTLFTAFEQFIGTPAYMSPEQAEMSALDIDTRSDIYSLGVLLYELLTGRTPFDAKELLAAGLDAMRRVIREQEPPRPSTRLSTMQEGELTTTANHRHSDPPKLIHLIRGDLDWIVMKTLEKDRTRRYETANDLAADLQRHLNNEPVVARPPSATYKLQKLIARNRLAFGAMVAVSLALLIGLGLSTWLYVREKEARKEAEAATARETQLRLKAEAGAKLFQARFLARNRDHDASEKLIASVTPLLSRMDPKNAADIYCSLGGLRAQQGRWNEAAADYARGIELEPKAFERYHWYIPVLARIKNVESYRRLRHQILRQFSEGADPRIAERVIKDCLISPWPDADFEIFDRLADTALKAGSNHWAWGYFQFAKGLVEYREAHFDSAVEYMQRALARPTEDRNRNVQAYMMLAMAHHQLKQSDEARNVLAMGLEFAKTNLPSTEDDLMDYVGWNDWIIAHALMDEAKALIEDGSKNGDEIK